MYLGAQRIIDDGGEPSVTLYLYLHGDGIPAAQRAMLSDVRWVSQLAPGQLARERHEGIVGGRRVVSYLEVTGPDETDIGTLGRILDTLEGHVAAGGKEPIVHGEWGAQLFRGADVGRDALKELADLRARLEQFFEDGGTVPPHRELTVEVKREGGETRFAWARDSRDRLAAHVSGWSPTRLSVIDDVRDAFEQQHGALFPHVLDMIRPDEVDLQVLGGVAFKDEATGKVLWFSPGKTG
jgi:hypothetical protein